jgi:hypothetical protein
MVKHPRAFACLFRWIGSGIIQQRNAHYNNGSPRLDEKKASDQENLPV